MDKHEIHLTVAVVDFKTKLLEPRKGVCTQWIKTWIPGDSIEFLIEKSHFTLPEATTPIICIGPGTGIAPMRSLLRTRYYQQAQGNRFSIRTGIIYRMSI